MLAIVVPAYRPQFFQLALNSIAAQTDKNFQCYIFDDAAPEEIKSISDNFPKFHYLRFEENMGRYDFNGFVNFPLAWYSDDATWCLLGKMHKIIAIPFATVQIRVSGINISSMRDKKTMKIKLRAFMLFYLWCIRNFNLPLSYKLKFMRRFVRYIYPSHFFQPLVFRNYVFILAMLLVPIRRLYLILKRLLGFNQNRRIICSEVSNECR
jgi:hypothetical protein